MKETQELPVFLSYKLENDSQVFFPMGPNHETSTLLFEEEISRFGNILLSQ